MSKQIEERVVEMRFDNAAFEKNVSTSLNTLSKLKKSLKLKGAEKGLENVDRAAKRVDLSNLERGVAFLEKRFSTLGIVGMRAVEKITDSMMNLGHKAMGFITEGVIQGGIKRATNIENARFMLEGLLKDEQKVNAVMDNAMESVDGTAYAFDEAAKAAAQFAASGIEAGEQMTAALRGITGVAAVGNAQYSEIAHIFNTVSGNGRVMAQQLNEISVRGINAASTMAEFFERVNDGSAKATEEVKAYVRALTGGAADVSEAQIREWVTKKKITADVFFAAMDDSFGDQAKKANETFNGALANVKSALARIGAEFVSPLIEQNGPLVGVLNVLREKINDIKSELAFDNQIATVNALTEHFGFTQKKAEKLFKTIEEAGGVVSIEQLESISSDAGKSRQLIADYINGVLNDTILASKETEEAIQKLRDEYAARFINRIINGEERLNDRVLTEGLRSLTQGVKITGEELRAMVDEGKLNLDFLNDRLIFTEKTVGDFAQDGMLGKGLFEDAMAEMVGEKSLAKKFTDSVSLMIKKWKEWLETTDGKAFGHNLSAALEGIVNIFKAIGSYLKPIGSAFAEVFLGADKMKRLAEGFRDFTARLKLSDEASQNLKNTFKGLFAIFDIIGKVIGGIIRAFFPAFSAGLKTAGGGVLAFTGNIGEMIYNFDQMLTESGKFQVIGEKVKAAFTAIGEAIKKGIEHIKNFFGMFKKEDPVSSSVDKMGKSFKAISTEVNDVTRGAKAISELKTVTLDSAKGVNTAAEQTTGALDEIKNSLTIDWEKVGKYGMVGVLSLVAVKVFKLVKGIATTVRNFMNNGVLGQLFFGNRIGEVFHSTSEAINSFALSVKADALKKIAGTILVLAGGLALLTLIDANELAKRLGIVSGLFIDLTGAMLFLMWGMKKLQSASRRTSDKGILGVLKESLGNLTRGAKDAMFIASISGMMVALAGSILMLSGAVAILAKTENLGAGLGAVSLLFGEVAGLIITVQMINKKVKGDGKGEFFTMSLAILSITVCVKALASVVKALGKLNPSRLQQGMSAFAGVMVAMAGVMAAMHLFKFDVKQGMTILLFCFSLMRVFKVVQKFSQMKWSELQRGLGGAIVAMGMLVGVIFAMALINKHLVNQSEDTGILQNQFVQMAAAMLIIANGCAVMASAIKKLSKLKPEKVTQGVIALIVMIGAMATALTLMSRLTAQNRSGFKNGVFGMEKSNLIQVAGAMMILAAALDVLTPAILALGLAAPIAMAGVIVIGALGAAFLGLMKLADVLKVGNVIEKFGKGVLFLGIACVAVAASVYIFIASIEKLANISTLSIGKFLINLELLLGGIAAVIASLVPIFVTALFNFINLSLKQLKTVIPQIAESLAQMAYSTIDALANYGPKIADRLFDLLNGILKVVAKRAPEFVETLAEAFHGIFDGIRKVMAADVGKFAELVTGTVTLAASMFLFSKIKLSMIGAAVKGVLAFGVFFSVFVLVIGGILAGIGELESLINVAPSIEKAGEVLEAIGNALGKGIGGFIGGVLEGSSDSLPAIADNISKFIENLQPAIDGFKLFADEESGIQAGLDAINNLMVVLAGTELADAYSQWTTFGNEKDISYIAAMLADFGTSISLFYENINKAGDVDPAKLENLAKAGVMLTLLVDKIPKTGGLNVIYDGVRDTAGFADGMAALAASLKSFYEASKDIDEGMTESITRVAKAAKAVVEAAASIPNSGGILEDWTGNNDIDKFGEKLGAFGKGIKEFADWGASFQLKDVNRAATAAAKIIELAKQIPNSEGLAGVFAGNNDADDFGNMLFAFGQGIYAFAQWGSKITLKFVNRAAEAGKKIIEVAKTIPNTMKLFGGLAVMEDLETFSEKIKAFGRSIAIFSEYGKQMDIKGFRKGINLAIRLLGLSEYVTDFSVFEGFDIFASSMGPLGQGLKDYCDAVNKANLDAKKVNDAAYILGSIIQVVTSIDDAGIAKMNTADLENFAAGITALGAAINSYCNSIQFVDGLFLGKARLSKRAVEVLVNIMDLMPSSGPLYDLFSGQMKIEDFSTQIKNFGVGLKNYGDAVKELDTASVAASRYSAMTIMDIFRDAPDLAAIAQSTGLGSGTLETFSAQLTSFGIAIKSYGDEVKGLDTKSIADSVAGVTGVMNVVRAIGDVSLLAEYTTGDATLSEFGGQLEAFGTSLVAFSGSAAKIDTSKINPLSTSLKLMFDTMVLALDKDAQPLVDLTKALGSIDTNGITNFLKCFDDEKTAKFVSTSEALKDGLIALFTAFQNAPDFAGIAGTGLGVGNIETFSKMLPAFGTALVDYANNVKDLGDTTKVSESVEGVQALMDVIRAIGTADDIQEMVGGDTSIEDLGNQLGTFGDKLFIFYDKTKGIKSSKINPLATSLKVLCTAAREAVDVSAQPLVNFTNTLAEINETGVDHFIQAFQNVDEAIRAIRHFISALTLGVDDSQVKADLLTAAGKIVTNLAEALETLLGDSRVGGVIKTKIAPAAKYIAEGIADHVSDSDNIGQIENALIVEFEAMANRDPLISGTQTAFEKVGGYLIEGLKQGIENNWPQFRQYWTNIMAELVVIAREQAGVASPSKEFIYIAKMCMEGLTQGIEQNKKKPTKALKDALKHFIYDAGSLSKGVRDVLQSVPEAITAYLDNYESVDSYTKKITEVYNKIYGSGGKRAMEYLVESIYKQSDAYKEAKANLKQYRTELNKAQEDVNNGVEGAADQVDQIKEQIKELTGQMAKDRKEVFAEYKKTIKESIASSISLFEEVNKAERISSTKLLDNMKSQYENVQKWADNIKILAGRGVSQAFIQDLISRGVSDASAVEALIKMTADDLAKADEYFLKSAAFPAEVMRELTAAAAKAGEEEAKAYKKGLKDGLKGKSSKDKKKNKKKKNENVVEEKINTPHRGGRIETATDEVEVTIPTRITYSLEEVEKQINDALDASEEKFLSYSEATSDAIEFISNRIGAAVGLFGAFAKTYQNMGDTSPVQSAKTALEEFGAVLLKDSDEYRTYIKEFEGLSEILSNPQLDPEDFKEVQQQLDELNKNWAESCVKAVQDVYDSVVDSAKSALSIFNTNLNTGSSSMSERTINSLKEDAKQIIDIFSSTAKISVDIFSKYSAGSSISKKSLLKIMAGQIAGVEKYEQLLGELAGTSISEGLYNSIKDMGTEGQGYIKAFLKMSEEEIAEANANFEKQGKMNAQAYLQAIKDDIANANRVSESLEVLLERGLSKDIYDQLKEQGVDAAETIQKLIYLDTQEIEEINGLFKKAQNGGKTASEKVLSNMQDQIDAAREWEQDLSDLARRGIDEGLLSQLRNMGPESAEYVKAFVEMTSVELGKANTLYKQQMITNSNTILESARRNLDDVKSWAANMNRLAARGISSALYTELAKQGVDGKETVAAIASMTDAELKELSSLYAELDEVPKAVADSIMTGLATNITSSNFAYIPKNIAAGISSTMPQAIETADTLADGICESLSSELNTDALQKIGATICTGIQNGVLNGQDSTISKCTALAKYIVTEFKTQLSADTLYNVGLQVDEGLASGINNTNPKSVTSANKLAKKVLKQLKKAFNINSPSKETEEMAFRLDEGFAVGLIKYLGLVKDASDEVANTLVDELNSGVYRVMDMADIDLNPVIRPTLDLSMIGAEAGKIKDILDYTEQLNVTLDGIKNDDVVDAIEDMRSDFQGQFDRLTDSVAKMQLVMDTGTLVGAIAGPMDKEMGKLASFQRRGMM